MIHVMSKSDREDAVIVDDIHGTIEIYGVEYSQNVFRRIAGADTDGKIFRLVPTAKGFHGIALDIEIIGHLQ